MTDYKLVPVEPTLDMLSAGLEVYGSEDCAEADVLGIFKAMLAAAPAVQGEPTASPTSGMNLGQRIQHVVGWETERGTVEFGSVMAVEALVSHVLRDIAVQGGPVAWMTHHDEPMFFATAKEASAYCDHDENPIPLYAAPQPADQQPAPDVAALVEALEAAQKEAVRGIKDARTGAQVAAALGRVSAIVGAALAAHRKGGE